MGSCGFWRVPSRIRSFLSALVAFAATPRDDIGEIIAAVIVGNLGACSDVLDRAYDDPVAYSCGPRHWAGTNDLRNVQGSFGSFRRSSNGC